jgi:hypothetical protein
MSVLRNDRLEVLIYLKESVARMRRLEVDNPGKFGAEMLAIAAQIESDVERLEVELVAAGFIPTPPTGNSAKTDYRLYIVDEKGAIQARQEFVAPNDAASLVADLVYRACSDTCPSYELWQAERQVIAFDGSRANMMAVPTDRQTIDIQEITLRVEESLQRGHWHIARNERLIAETQRLKERIGNETPG